MKKETDKTLSIQKELTDFLLYKGADGQVKVEVFLHEENIWLTLNQLAKLFAKDKSGVSRHLKNIFESLEIIIDNKIPIKKIDIARRRFSVTNFIFK